MTIKSKIRQQDVMPRMDREDENGGFEDNRKHPTKNIYES